MSHSLVLPSALYATDEEIDSTSQKKEKKDKKDKKEKKEKKDKKEARVLLSDEEADDGAFRKRKAVLNEPVLPAPKFATLATEHNDEEKTQHQGRTRKFEHVEGNWAVHVYIPLHFETDAATLLTITNVLEEWKRFQSSSSSESSSCHDHPALQLSFEQSPLESLHVSLSHTAPIRDFEIEPFLSALAAELAQLGTSVSSTSTSSCTSVALQHVTSFVIPTALSMPPIDITLSGVEFYRNDDSTRVFAALQVHDQNRSTSSPTSITVDSSSTHDALYDAPIAVAQNVDAKERVTQESIRDKESLFSTDPQCFNPLRDLSRAVDGTYRKFRLPTFYSRPRPHVSFAWALPAKRSLGPRCDESERNESSAGESVLTLASASTHCSFTSSSSSASTTSTSTKVTDSIAIPKADTMERNANGTIWSPLQTKSYVNITLDAVHVKVGNKVKVFQLRG